MVHTFPELGRLKQEPREFKASLTSTLRPHLKPKAKHYESHMAGCQGGHSLLRTASHSGLVRLVGLVGLCLLSFGVVCFVFLMQSITESSRVGGTEGKGVFCLDISCWVCQSKVDYYNTTWLMQWCKCKAKGINKLKGSEEKAQTHFHDAYLPKLENLLTDQKDKEKTQLPPSGH